MPLSSTNGPQGRLSVSISAQGAGDPILFVHSDGGTLRHWDDIRNRLNDRTTAAFDRRGHGQSASPNNGSFDQTEGADDIAAVADNFAFSKFILVAHSGGAANAFVFATAHPERLSGLVLVDPPGDPQALPAGMMEQQLAAMESDYLATVESYYRSIAGNNPVVVERVLADVRSTPPKTIIGSLKALSGFRPRQVAAQLPRPALSIVQSRFDVEGALHRIAPGFRHVVIDGAGHWIQLGAPDEFADALSSFLSGKSRDTTRAA